VAGANKALGGYRGAPERGHLCGDEQKVRIARFLDQKDLQVFMRPVEVICRQRMVECFDLL
jgi:hypothetical protein